MPDLHNEVCACLHGILNGLKPEYSEALRAVDLGEQRLQDFAQQHKLSASNAGVRIHRARAALRKQLLRTCRGLFGARLPELHLQEAFVLCHVTPRNQTL
jgi:DNA-directed RNA polymerase specialized sigma24 family protein